MSTARRPGRRRSVVSLGTICLVLTVVSVVLAIALVQAVRSHGGGHQANATDETVAALTTEVARERQLVAAGQSTVTQQQRVIEELQKAASAQPTPTAPASGNGPRSFLASFLSGQTSYVLYMDWTESNGFITSGRILTADNYQAKSTKSLQFSGVDNNGSYGFTGSGGSAAIAFTGTRNGDGSLTVSGVPWSVFAGFVGGTFSQTLHPSSIADYNATVSSLAHQRK